MKNLIKFSALILAVVSCSCTVVKTKTASGGEATFASLGGDSRAVAIAPEGATLEENKNSAAFGKAVGTATTITGILSAAGVTGK